MQRCYKIHGYPSGHKFFKGRKIATVVHSDSVQEPSSQSSIVVPALTSEQYSQRLQLLNKHTSDLYSGTRNGGMGAASFLTGKRYCLFTSSTNKAWIIYSGASDHISSNL